MSRRSAGLVPLLLLFLGTVPLAAQGAEGLYSTGSRAFQDGLYPMAARSLRQLVERYPDHPLADDAEYLRGLAEFYQQEYARLLAVFEDFPRRYPQSPFLRQVDFWMGSACYRLGRYAEAVTRLGRQADRYPQEREYSDRALLLKGAAQEKLETWAEALKTYRRLLDGSPAAELESEAWFRLGSVQLVLQEYGAALASFTRVMVNFPASAQAEEALFYAGESLFFAGRYLEAEKRYRLVLQGSPEPGRQETSRYRLARLLARLDRPKEALAAVEELQRLHPRGRYAVEYPLLAAEACYELGRFREAQEHYRLALAAAAGPAERQKISYNLALAALASGEPEEALEPLRAALEGGDGGIAEQSLYRLAAAQAELGQEAEALRAAADFRARFPGSPLSEEVLGLEASLLDRSGRSREARELFTQLLARYPRSGKRDEYLFKRGGSYLRDGETAAALKDFVAVAQQRPGSAFRDESTYNIGYIYSQRGEFARAMPYLAEVAERQGDSELGGRAVLAAGVCRFNAGDYAGALEWFQRLPASGPEGSPWRQQAWYYRGRALYKMERLEEAAESFARAAAALEGSPEGEDALYWRAVSLFRLERLTAAREAFLELAARNPSGPRAAEGLYRAGMCSALAGDHAAGIAHFDRALAAARKSAVPAAQRGELLQEIYLQKGLSLLAQGSRGKALEVFETLAREYPQGKLAAEGRLALAETDFRSGQFAAALAGFRLVAEEHPRLPAGQNALYWAGAAAARLGRTGEALDHLLRYIEAAPAGGQARAAEEEIRRILLAGTDDKALRDFLRRIEASRVPAALKHQARFEHARGVLERSPEEALPLLLSLRDAGPREPLAGEVSYWIGETYRRRGDLNRALEIFGGIASSRSDRTGALAQAGIGAVRAQQGRSEEAAEEHLKVYFLFPQFKDLAQEGLYRAGRIYWDEGSRDRAGKLFEKLEDEYPDSRWLDELPGR